MFGLQTIDIGLGLVFVYFVLSVICSGVKEIIAGLLHLRANSLVEGIESLLKNQGIANLETKFYEHPLIRGLCKNEKKPSYIPSRTFALTVIDMIVPAKPEASRQISDVRAAIEKIDPESPIRKTLAILLENAENDIQKLQKGIETWFNDAMDRVSGWYKQKAQLIIFLIAAFLVGLTNADTLQIVKVLSYDPTLRQELSKQAADLVKQSSAQPSAPAAPGPKGSEVRSDIKGSSPPTQGQEGGGTQPPSWTLEEGMRRLQGVQTAGIPLGWKTTPKGWEWVNKIVGLLLTVFAASLGAPFWFDLLNKIVSVRSVGASPEEKERKKRKDENT